MYSYSRVLFSTGSYQAQTQAGRHIVGVYGVAYGFEAPPFAGARHEHFKDAAKINADGFVFYEDGRDVDIEAEELALRRRHRAHHSLSSSSWPSWRQHPLAFLYEALDFYLAVD